MNRGAARQQTFLHNYDRDDFVGLWQEAVDRFGIVVLAYALMGNHYHVLVVSPDGQLSETLRHIGFVYTQRFNRRHERDGALFRGRFHSILVDSDEYLERVARYIERNPLEAGVVGPERLASYRWSSLHHYLRPTSSDWVTTGPLLNRVGSRSDYLRYVLSDIDDVELENFYSQVMRPRLVLGKPEFVASLPKEARQLGPIVGVPEVSLSDIDSALAEVSEPFNSTSRIVAAQLGQQFGRASCAELADRYEFSSNGAVSQASLRARRSMEAQELRARVLNYLGLRDASLPR